MKHSRLIVLAALAGMLVLSTGAGAAVITINNMDGAGEGLNDPTPVLPIGGNPGTTLGMQRLIALQQAAELAGGCLLSDVPVQVNAAFNPLACTTTSAVLGSAGAVAALADFTGAPLANTWYPIALANAITGVDNDIANPDIGAQFNSNIGTVGCLTAYQWYYGLDGNASPGTIDFVTVALHEITHGLGFASFINVSTGAEFGGFDDVYEANSENHGAVPSTLTTMSNAQRVAAVKADPNLHWTGAYVTAASGVLSGGVSNGHVQLYGPATLTPGSTLSHWNTALSPDQLMEPAYTGPNHQNGLATELLQDIGWTVQCPVAVAISSFGVRATDRGAMIDARFESTFPNVLVNVYRGAGRDGALNVLATQSMSGRSTFSYVDESAVPGKSYRYMIGVVDGEGEFVSPIQSFTMPAASTRLEQNMPNPFNPTTAIRFSLASKENVTLAVYDIAGRLVRSLVNGTREVGSHEMTWDGRDNAGASVSSGVYFYRLDAGKFSQTRKMVLLK
ncbi:MAG TPA: FlgD immunoglobulin-like domain containing protein [Candidatus Krumholzibacteria bacterium]